MNTSLAIIKQHPLIKGHEIKEYEMSWNAHPRYINEGGFPHYIRDRFMYLTVELKSGEIFNFKKDTYNGNIYLI